MKCAAVCIMLLCAAVDGFYAYRAFNNPNFPGWFSPISGFFSLYCLSMAFRLALN